MSIQLRRPIVAGYGPASRGAIARDDARRREEARVVVRARADQGADRRARSTSMTPKRCWRCAHDVIDATRSTHDAHRLARARVYAHRTVDARDDDGVRGARSVDWARHLE